MTDSDRYVAAFQGLLDQLDKQLAEAKQEIVVFAEFIQGHRNLPVGRQMKFRRRLLTLEAERIIRGGKGPIREADALLTDPVSSSKLIIPELAGRILGRIADRAGRLLWAAFSDGLVTEPVRLWEYLKCRPPHAEPNDSWAFAVDCLRASHPLSFKSTAGEWSRVDETRKVIELVIQVLGAVGTGGDVTTTPHTRHDNHKPSEWFWSNHYISNDSLRSAHRRGKLQRFQPNKETLRYLYSIDDAMKLWPDKFKAE